MKMSEKETNKMTSNQQRFITRLLNRGKLQCELKYCGCGCGRFCREECEYIHNHHRIGKNNTEEHNKKIGKANSISLKGKKQPKDLIEKRSISNTGKKRSKETRKKQSLAAICKPKSEKHKESLSISMLKLFQNKENHPCWKGGISQDPYCSIFRDENWRKMIYERDNKTCQCCGITNLMSYKLFGSGLIIHHIDHDKQNCNPNNCITVCRSCNAKVEGKKLKIIYKYLFKMQINIKENNQ